MKEHYYDTIFKRKSFHLFRNVGSDKISPEELEEIEKAYLSLEPLYPEIRTAIRIVNADQVNFKRDAEYCILIYSEKKDNYLMNAGFIGEQLDLWLVEHNIGSLWFGIGKPDEPSYNGLDYVIMIAVHKVNDEAKYRKDMFKSKRKTLAEIWSGDDLGIADISRFAPSACNTQPWHVKNEAGILTVSRYKKPGKRGIMPEAAVSYYNRIDIGIYLCFLEICLEKNGIAFMRELFTDDGSNREYTKSAQYRYYLPESFPAEISAYIDKFGAELITEYHCSGDLVYRVGNAYILKISTNPERLKRERRVNDFLKGKVPVSETVAFCEDGASCFYLKTCVEGSPIVGDNLKSPERAADYLAEAMKMYHSIDISDCDIYNPDSEGNCFVHGDFCLPNILVKDGRVSGFIDTEASGIGDPWMDYAWCIWSYEYNLGTKEYTPLLLKKLGIEFDREKFDKYTEI